MQSTYKIFCLGADKENSTDGVIVKGVYNLLDSIFDKNEKEYLFIDDDNEMDLTSLPKKESVDLVVVCGTPWLWDSFQLSQKYKNLENIFKYFNKVKKIFMGAGSCLNISCVDSNIVRREEEIKGIVNLYENTCVITRDILAYEIIKKANLKAYNLPCPAYFCYGIEDAKYNDKTNNILIWCDPQLTISQIDWQDADKLKKYYDVNLNFYEKYKPEVYCAKKEEIAKAVEIGLPEPKVLNGYNETLKIMNNARIVLSGRVHCAVPAFVQGAKLGILPLDTRSFVLTNYGCQAINEIEDLEKLSTNKIDIKDYHKKYKLLIESYIRV